MMTLEMLRAIGAVIALRVAHIVVMRRVLVTGVAPRVHAVMRVMGARAHDRSEGCGEPLQRHEHQQCEEHEFSSQRKHLG